MIHDRLIHALVQSKNEAADDVLLEALRLAAEEEKPALLEALLKRPPVRGPGGVIGMYDSLSEPLQVHVLSHVRELHHALRECGRSDDVSLRLAAMKLIALGRQGKLAYVLSENLHASDETLSKAAVEAMVALARWVATVTRGLQKGFKVEGSGFGVEEKGDAAPAATGPSLPQGSASQKLNLLSPNPKTQPLIPKPSAPFSEASAVYNQLLTQRPEIETAVARAMDVNRGRHGPDLLRAALLLADWPLSRTLGILHTAKHGGQSAMVRRLQQPPASEHVEAFLLGASHGQLRSHFGSVFAHIEEAPVLDALLRKTHWLKDVQLQLCIHQVTRGAWWGEAELAHDIARRSPEDAARVGEWLGASGAHDVVQDERMEALRAHAADSFPARLRLLRVAAGRRRGTSVGLLKSFLDDPDERLVRMAARELVRRRPPEFENVLLQRMTSAPASVRRVISRALGHVGFEHFWQRFDRLDRATRRQAGRAMLKILPDAVSRLARRLSSGPVEQRLKAMQMTHDLNLAGPLKDMLVALAAHPNPKVRSKAVSVLGDVPGVPTDVLLERVLNDTDSRVRANAVEVLESSQKQQFLPLLASRARAGHNRERANAIKAMHKMKVGPAGAALTGMLRDDRPEHRVSALWALKQMGWWKLLGEVGRLAKEDSNLRVRRYALGVLRGVAEMLQAEKGKIA